MFKGQRYIPIIMALVSLGFLVEAGVSVYHQKQSDALVVRKQIIAVKASVVIGSNNNFQGGVNSSYTLVEFGDYQCPPCHEAYWKVKEAIKHSSCKVRFVFRNLPLTGIHPFAVQAAISAEAAREQGRFWPTHDALYQIDVSDFRPQTVESVVQSQSLNRQQFVQAYDTTAKLAVATDVADAKRLGVESTPSFFVCCPSGSVVRVDSPDDLGKVVENIN